MSDNCVVSAYSQTPHQKTLHSQPDRYRFQKWLLLPLMQAALPHSMPLMAKHPTTAALPLLQLVESLSHLHNRSSLCALQGITGQDGSYLAELLLEKVRHTTVWLAARCQPPSPRIRRGMRYMVSSAVHPASTLDVLTTCIGSF